MNIYRRTLDVIRLKITDRCSWDCWFCHNEGTGQRYKSQIQDIFPDRDLLTLLLHLRNELGISGVHLTGGEPTLNPRITDLTQALVSQDFSVQVTTVASDIRLLERLIKSGISSINVSMHSLDVRSANLSREHNTNKRLEQRLSQQKDFILAAKDRHVPIKVNCVMSDFSDKDQIAQFLEWCLRNEVVFRFLTELTSHDESAKTIRDFWHDLGGTEICRTETIGTSDVVSTIQLPSGQIIYHKYLQKRFFDRICASCSMRDSLCQEKFYGLRLEKRSVNEQEDKYYLRLCLHRSDIHTLIPVDPRFPVELLHDLRSQLRLKTPEILGGE